MTGISRLTGSDFAVAHCRLPAWELGDTPSISAASSIGFSFTAQHCVVDHGGRSLKRRVQSGTTIVVGAEVQRWLRVDQPSELVEVWATPALRQSIADELSVPGAHALADTVLADDPVVRVAALRLATLAGRDGAALEAESLVRRLYGRVLMTRFGGRLRERSNGALDHRRLRRVIDYIDAHLAGDLSLTQLAEVAALSPFHFQRSFTAATGSSPHRAVQMIRRHLAHSMIKGGLPEAAAARRVGLANARALRRIQ